MSDDERKRVTMGDIAIAAFGEITTMYMDALNDIAASEGESRHMKVLVVAIPVDDAAPGDADDNQLTQMQILSNLDHEEVPKVLRQVTDTVQTATAKGVTKRTVLFVAPTEGEPN